MAATATHATQADYPPPARGEPHWPPMLAVALAIGLQLLLPSRLTAGSKYLLPALELILLISLFVVSPFTLTGRHRWRRRISIITAGVVSVANGISLGLLVHLLLSHNLQDGRQLVIAGALIWLTNVLLFSLWYWELDRGGPGFRAAGEDGVPDFLFPQMGAVSLVPGWRPMFVDYVYVSLTNATAFSPTDTMPLSKTVKAMMSVQSLISLVTLGLVVARAVNVL